MFPKGGQLVLTRLLNGGDHGESVSLGAGFVEVRPWFMVGLRPTLCKQVITRRRRAFHGCYFRFRASITRSVMA